MSSYMLQRLLFPPILPLSFEPASHSTLSLGRHLSWTNWRRMDINPSVEQVSHHPFGWILHQEIKITSKFLGKYLSIMLLGNIHCIFHTTGHHYTWRKVTTTVHNIIVDKLWIDQSGEIDIVNYKTGDKCNLKFVPYSYFSWFVARKVTGEVTRPSGKVHFALLGTWDGKMSCFKVQPASGENEGNAWQRGHGAEESRVMLWKRNPLPKNAENMYYLSELALSLNAWEDSTVPTGSQSQPDQRLMENEFWNAANAEKKRLEEKQ